MKVTVDREVPPGVYHVILSHIKEIESSYGPAILLIFVIQDQGQYYGQEVTVLANLSVSASSKLGKFIIVFRGGQPLQQGEEIELNDYKGIRGLATVAINEKNGRANVESFTAQQQQQAAPPAATTEQPNQPAGQNQPSQAHLPGTADNAPY